MTCWCVDPRRVVRNVSPQRCSHCAISPITVAGGHDVQGDFADLIRAPRTLVVMGDVNGYGVQLINALVNGSVVSIPSLCSSSSIATLSALYSSPYARRPDFAALPAARVAVLPALPYGADVYCVTSESVINTEATQPLYTFVRAALCCNSVFFVPSTSPLHVIVCSFLYRARPRGRLPRTLAAVRFCTLDPRTPRHPSQMSGKARC